MRLHPGVLCVLLAACALPPAPTSTPSRGLRADDLALLRATEVLPARLGVEYVETRHAFATTEEPRGKAQADGPQRAGGQDPAPRPMDARPRAKPDERRPAEVEDGFGRVAIRFVEEIAGYDHKHEPRNLDQISVGERLRQFSLPEMTDPFDARAAEERDQLMERWQPMLLGKPLQRAVRESPVIKEFIEAIDVFRAENVPLSEPYREQHRNGSDYGRVTMRVRLDRLSDPAELVYSRSGWRAGSSLDWGKLGYSTRLADKVWLSLRGKYRYDDGQTMLEGSVEYRFTKWSRAYLLVSDHLDPFGEPFSAPVASQWGDDSPGVMIVIQRVF